MVPPALLRLRKRNVHGRLNASWKICSLAVNGQSFLVIFGYLLNSSWSSFQPSPWWTFLFYLFLLLWGLKQRWNSAASPNAAIKEKWKLKWRLNRPLSCFLWLLEIFYHVISKRIILFLDMHSFKDEDIMDYKSLDVHVHRRLIHSFSFP